MWNADPVIFAERHGLSAQLAKRFRCTAEHLNARSTGGSDTSDNIVAACAHCNRMRHKRKRPRTPEDHRRHVAKRVQLGRWHPSQAGSAFAVSRD
jgi:5-methylcytosine-specific restriction endonuclease McrA